MKKYYYYGSSRVAVRQGSTLTYLISDHLGSTSLVYETSGTKQGELCYKAFGEDRYTNGTIPTTRKYTGQSQEDDLDLYWYNSRFYDPLLSRFSSADTLIPRPGRLRAIELAPPFHFGAASRGPLRLHSEQPGPVYGSERAQSL